MGSIGDFAEEFWNVEVGDFGGWEVVSRRAKETAKVTVSCIDFMKQVAAALDTFGKTLLRVARGASLPEQENGRRQQQVREGVRRVHQAQRHAQNKMKDLVEAEAYSMTLHAKRDTKPKEKEKAAQAEERATEVLKEAENIHKDTVASHNVILENWCSSAASAFRTMQDVEEARVKLVRDSFWSVANICSLLAVHVDQHQEVARTALQRVDVVEELAAWVAEHRTFQTQPIPLVYTPVAHPPPTPNMSTPALTPSSSARSTLTEMSASSEDSDASPVPVRKARALYRFSARSGSEVCLAAGEAVVVMEGSSPEWSLVRTEEGNMGFVPTKFLTATATLKKEV